MLLTACYRTDFCLSYLREYLTDRRMKAGEYMKKCMVVGLYIMFFVTIIATGRSEATKTEGKSASMDILSNTTAIRQLNAPVYVLDFCGSKYVLNLKVNGKNANSLLSLSSGEVLHQFNDRIRLVGYCNGFIYYVPRGNFDVRGSLMYYDLRSMKSRIIDCEYTIDPLRASIYTTSGLISIPLRENSNGYHYAVILEDRILSYEERVYALQIESSRYYMIVPDPFIFSCNLYSTEQVVLIDEHDQEQLIDLSIERSIARVGVYDVDNKCIIYCDQGPQILFMLDSDHKPVLVFSCECIHSETAFAIQGTNAIISVKRYEKLGQTGYGYSRYSNDVFEGTYLVNLLDLSSKKISDTVFCGLFCPDESSVYGCDEEGNVYLLHFSGESEMVFIQ